jgi:thiol:disulfide interchange protein DsbC
MTLKSLHVLAAAFALSLAGIVQAQTGVAANPVNAQAAPAAKADPRADIVKKIDGLKLEDVRMTPVNGIYEITRGSEISYTTGDGRYVILGDMVDIDSDQNLSENRRRTIRQRLIDTVPESEMLVFGPKNPKYTITVFTDIDCGYCRRLHSQIAEYNRLGIRVRYLFYPRTGPDTDSWHKAEAVWCAPNRNDSLTRAKNGEDIKSPKCPTDIVKRDWELGHKLGIEGTPAIFLASGEMLGGYAPPTTLLQYLKTGKM